jgi:hypothetical protein
MHLFVNSLEGKDANNIFKLPSKFFSTWDELSYWFKSTYGQPKIPTDKIKDYNNLVYNEGETIKYFNLHFTKLYNQILDIIKPHNQSTLMHYYNTLPASYKQRLEENNVDNLGSALQTCLEFEEKLAKTCLPSEYYVKKNDMSIVLQLV